MGFCRSDMPGDAGKLRGQQRWASPVQCCWCHQRRAITSVTICYLNAATRRATPFERERRSGNARELSVHWPHFTPSAQYR